MVVAGCVTCHGLNVKPVRSRGGTIQGGDSLKLPAANVGCVDAYCSNADYEVDLNAVLAVLCEQPSTSFSEKAANQVHQRPYLPESLIFHIERDLRFSAARHGCACITSIVCVAQSFMHAHTVHIHIHIHIHVHTFFSFSPDVPVMADAGSREIECKCGGVRSAGEGRSMDPFSLDAP